MERGLASWFAIWHPRYRGLLIALVAAGACTSCLVYVQNDLLSLLTRSLSVRDEPSAAGPEGLGHPAAVVAAWLGVRLPFLALGLFILAKLVAAALEYGRAHVTGKLRDRSSNDIEDAVFSHLLRKDDAFYSRHSPAETVNRLGGDLQRVVQLRLSEMNICWLVLPLIGHLVFFLVRDWRLAVVAMAACGASSLWTLHMTREVKSLDLDYLREDDHVKSRFEDYLRAAPEVQISRLYGRVQSHFQEAQAGRTRLFERYTRINAFLRVGTAIAYLSAFAAMVAVVWHLRRTGDNNAALALVPVVIWVLPELFRNASELTFMNVELQIARTSMTRLLEYEAHELGDAAPVGASTAAPARPGLPGSAAPRLRLEGATYRYPSPDGTLQGGVTQVTTAFAPHRWTALVGGAGSGKSTLLKLLLGRLKPQAGAAFCGDTPLERMPEDDLAALLSLMPQSLALLNSTIRQNLLFGKTGTPPAPPALDAADLDVVERAGLGRVCRLKALDMVAGSAAEGGALRGGAAAMRERVRQRLRDACGAEVLPYEAGHSDPKHWILECLLGGRCDRGQAIGLLLDPSVARKLRPLVGTGLGAELADLGRNVLSATERLLRIANFHVYSQLAPFPLDERLWQLRSSHVDLASRAGSSAQATVTLATIGLTCAPAELAGDERSGAWCRPDARAAFPAEIGQLRPLAGAACQAFALAGIHPHLTWRENLVFGVVACPNSRAGRLVEEELLAFVDQSSFRDSFTQVGLEFEIGRQGGNLSGGQGQLVALCRALLRRAPVLVLDEPTSALDPASRARVAELLKSWKAGRVVITVSHDTEFIRQADEIKLMDGGRIVACGTFEELEAGCDAFRRTLQRP